MPYFDRFDICEAYFCLEMEWNTGGHIPERTAKRYKAESIGVQLDRMKFRPSPMLGGRKDLNENAREIYDALVVRYFPGRCPACGGAISGEAGWNHEGCDAFEATAARADDARDAARDNRKIHDKE